MCAFVPGLLPRPWLCATGHQVRDAGEHASHAPLLYSPQLHLMRTLQHKTVQEGKTWVYSGYLRESDGARHGAGTFTYPSGQVYEGEWNDGNRNGRGKQTFPNGEVYEGEFKDGRRNGQGTMTHANGRRESGAWRDDKFLG